MKPGWVSLSKAVLLAGLLASSFTVPASSQTGAQPAGGPNSTAGAAPVSNASPQPAGNWHAREGTLYRRNWGVDIVGVRRVSSGEMLVFKYVVLDPARAEVLNDKRQSAVLIDEATGTRLIVPQMEKVGLLRTTAKPEANHLYWMVFPNTHNLVKPGSRVSVVIGNFRVDGLTVE